MRKCYNSLDLIHGRWLRSRALTIALAVGLGVSFAGSAAGQCTAVEVRNQTGVDFPTNALGLRDNQFASLHTATDVLQLDLPAPVAGGTTLLIYLRRRAYGDGGTAQVQIQSALGSAGFGQAKVVSVASESQSVSIPYTVTSPVDVLRFAQFDGAGDDFEIDAVEVPCAGLMRCGLLANGDVESGLVGWNQGNGAGLSTDDYRGRYAIELRNDESTGRYFDALPSDLIEVQFMAKVVGTLTTAEAGITYHDANWNTIRVETALSLSGTTYKSYVFPRLNAPVGTRHITVWWQARGTGALLLDDLCVTQESQGTVRGGACAAFDQGSFEGALDKWNGIATTTAAFAGSKAGHIPAGTSKLFAVAVEPGQRYTLDIYASVSDPSTGWSGFGADFLDATGTSIAAANYRQITSTVYAPYGLPEFTIPSGAAFVRCWFAANSGPRIYLDEVCLTRVDVAKTHELAWTNVSAMWNFQVGGWKGGGLNAYDWNHDGLLDLTVNTDDDARGTRLLRQQVDGTFYDVTAAHTTSLLTGSLERSCVWGDLNNDGKLDFIRNTHHHDARGAAIEIYLQDPVSGRLGNGVGGMAPFKAGNPTFSPHIPIHDGVNTEGMGMVDFDGDGDLDIIFDNHDFGIDILRNNFINHTTRARSGVTGAGLFTHATQRNGAAVVLGLNQTATDGDYGAFVDINDDGWVDIFMRKRDENDFFFNQGGTFVNGTDIAQAANVSKGSNAIYDFDNDGDFDVFWTENGPNQIFRNDHGTWVPLGASGVTGIPTTLPSKITEAAGGDVDNDGDIDLMLVGHGGTHLYINQLNDPIRGVDVGQPMTFVEDTRYRFTTGFPAYGTLLVDIDNDGDLDAVFNRNNATMAWRNELYDASTLDYDKDMLRVRVWDDRAEYMAPGRERPALGATVILTDCNGHVLSGMREVSGGNGRGTQNPHDIHFGLPYGRDYNYTVVVKYPNYRHADGRLERKVISKTFNPSTFGNATPLVVVRTADGDEPCPGTLEICSNGIDDDGDGDIDCDDLDCGSISIEPRISR